MMKSRALLLLLSVVAVVCLRAAINLPPNRGTELLLLMEADGRAWEIVAMETPSKWISQEWNQYNSTYDFIMAVLSRSDSGCKVSFTRYVMKDDYLPLEEHFEAEFPYSQQARYPFFERGYIIGFYRISFDDFDRNEILFRQSSNQLMKPTSVNKDTRQVAPFRNKSSVFATTSCRGLSPSR
jgi:hypothetical protein